MRIAGRRRLLPAFVLVLLLALGGGPAGAADPGCGEDAPCDVPLGRYWAAIPPGWDGVQPLPLAMFLHGFGGSGEEVVKQWDFVADFRRRGVLLIAPDGRGADGAAGGRKGWSFPGSPSRTRDDVAFLHQVLADAMRRFPIDRTRVLGTGHSIGGSMLWTLACAGTPEIVAYLPIAGAFWTPLPDACPGPPVNLMHVHGVMDTTVPLKGRPIRDRWRQGDVPTAIDLMRRHDACPVVPDRIVMSGASICQVWSVPACASGRELQFCLHPGEHELPTGWADRALDWLETVRPNMVKADAPAR